MYGYDQVFRSELSLKLVKSLLEIAKQRGLYEDVASILFEGKYNSFEFTSNMSTRDNPEQEQQRRISMVYLLLTNPETFKELAKDNSFIFHGTNINALPGVLKYGLNSFKKSVDLGINVNTGEEITRRFNPREFVSFADIFDIALDYSTLSTVTKTKISFPIIICTNKDRLKKYRRIYRIQTDVPEIPIKDGISIDDITAILVPSEKVKYVKKLVGDKNVKVLACDTRYEKKFYWYNECSQLMDVHDDKLEALRNNTTNKSVSKFDMGEIKELVNKRLLSGIKNQFQKLTDLLKGEEKEYVGKCK